MRGLCQQAKLRCCDAFGDLEGDEVRLGMVCEMMRVLIREGGGGREAGVLVRDVIEGDVVDGEDDGWMD